MILKNTLTKFLQWISPDCVKILKLTSGEEIIGMYNKTLYGNIKLGYPLSIITAGNIHQPRVSFNKYCVLGQWETVKIQKSHIVATVDVTENLHNFYFSLIDFVIQNMDEKLDSELIEQDNILQQMSGFSENIEEIPEDLKEKVYTKILESIEFSKESMQ
jgi:hypothetical protein